MLESSKGLHADIEPSQITPKSYVVTSSNANEQLFFAVVSDIIEQDKILCGLRYRYQPSLGMVKMNDDEAYHYLATYHPHFLFHSQNMDVALHGVPVCDIKKVLSPWTMIQQLSALIQPDQKQSEAMAVIRFFVDHEVKPNCLGVTGSLMLNAHNENSDIDMLVNDRQQFHHLRNVIKQAINIGDTIKPLSQTAWQDAYHRRQCELSFQQYYEHEKRKYNKFMIADTKVDVSLLSSPPISFQRCKKIAKTQITARVIDDHHAFDLPACYTIDHSDIKYIISPTATYVGQAIVGEYISARGWLESNMQGQQHLLVGSSREARDEYLLSCKLK